MQDGFISNISKSMDQSDLFYVSKNDLSFWFVVVIHPKVDLDLFCGEYRSLVRLSGNINWDKKTKFLLIQCDNDDNDVLS